MRSFDGVLLLFLTLTIVRTLFLTGDGAACQSHKYVMIGYGIGLQKNLLTYTLNPSPRWPRHSEIDCLNGRFIDRCKRDTP